MAFVLRPLIWVALASVASSACSRAHTTPEQPEHETLPPAGAERTPALPVAASATPLPTAVTTTPRPSCAAAPTTFADLVLNLDSNSVVPPAWSATDPAGTSNFSISLTLFDRSGAAADTVIHFARRDTTSWEVHAMLGQDSVSPGVEIGAGMLFFNDEGALRASMMQPLRLPASDGSDPSLIELGMGTSIERGGDGLDGVVHSPAPSNVMGIDRDGRRALVGFDCIDDPRSLPVLGHERVPGWITGIQALGHCASDPTHNLSIHTNLNAPLASADQNADAADAGWSTSSPLWVVNAEGVHAVLRISFRHEEAQRWIYRVRLHSEAPESALASGSLLFSAAGALLRHDVDQALRFPNPDGTWGDAITLDFGPERDDGGNGVDGTTAFGSAQTPMVVRMNGVGPSATHACPASASLQDASLYDGDVPAFGAPSDGSSRACGGVFTQRIHVTLLLPSDAPIVSAPWETRSPSLDGYTATATIFDSEALPADVTLSLRRRTEAQWDYQVTLTHEGRVTSLGDSTLTLSPEGWVDAMGPAIAPFRLPLADGTPGPAITIDLGNPGTRGTNLFHVFMIDDTFDANLSPDGQPVSDNDDCLTP